MKYIIISLVFIFIGQEFNAQTFNPEKYLGYKIGTRFTPQHTVVSYFKALEVNFSTQLKIENYGKPKENRFLSQIIAKLS